MEIKNRRVRLVYFMDSMGLFWVLNIMDTKKKSILEMTLFRTDETLIWKNKKSRSLNFKLSHHECPIFVFLSKVFSYSLKALVHFCRSSSWWQNINYKCISHLLICWLQMRVISARRAEAWMPFYRLEWPQWGRNCLNSCAILSGLQIATGAS